MNILAEGAESMGQIANGMAKREMTHSLKVQSKYDESDREWRGKGRVNVLSENTYDGSDCGVAKGEMTYTLKARSGYDDSDREWGGREISRTY